MSERNPGSLRVLTREECLELLTTTAIGLVAFVDKRGQQLIPVNYVLHDYAVYFRTGTRTALAPLELGHPDVALGIYDQESMFRAGWNVTVRGRTEGVLDTATIGRVRSLPGLLPWAGGSRPLVIRLLIDEIAGRHVEGR